MSETRVQNYANHPYTPKWFLVQGLAGLLGLGVMGWGVVTTGSENSQYFLGVGALLVGITVATINLQLRFTALKLQDRIIRLESTVRLYRVLPADMHAQIPTLSLGQLVCLRFASDAELPELTRKVLADKIEDRKTIKKMVKNWQADWMRI